MLRDFELNVKNPAFAKQKNSSNAKGFLWRTRANCLLTKGLQLCIELSVTQHILRQMWQL